MASTTAPAAGFPDGSAYDTCQYSPAGRSRELRGARSSLPVRGARCSRSVDKVNVLETSRLWRETVTRGRRRLPRTWSSGTCSSTPRGLQLVQHPGAIRRDPDREHVRRHPLRRRERGVCGGLGLAASASLGRRTALASSSRCTAPRRTSRAGESPILPGMLRSIGAAAPARRGRARAGRPRSMTRVWDRHWPRRPRPTRAGGARTAEFSDFVLEQGCQALFGIVGNRFVRVKRV